MRAIRSGCQGGPQARRRARARTTCGRKHVVRALDELTRLLTDRFDAEAEAVAVIGQRLAALTRARGAHAGRAGRAAFASVTTPSASPSWGLSSSTSRRRRARAIVTAASRATRPSSRPRCGARHPALVHSFLLNPDLAPPGSVEALVASGRLVYSDRVDVDGARLLHVCSPIELDVPISRLWPAAAASRGMRLAVTLYDLIPEIFAERYLADPGLRRRYRSRLELVRAADVSARDLRDDRDATRSSACTLPEPSG